MSSSFSSSSFCVAVTTSCSRFSVIVLNERCSSPIWSRRRTGMRTEKSPRRTASVARDRRLTARDSAKIITAAISAAAK